jgi:methyltransferase (TIGR00027 family)
MDDDRLLRDVSDTALGVAVERAQETERRRPLFRDPYAARLAGERGQRIAAAMRHRAVSSGIAVRTAALDEMILQTLALRGARCVLNLGAGLDTRPYWLDLPADLRWVEADLPGILDYKERMLADERPRCRLERLRADLADPDARRRVLDEAAGGQPTLVVSEGVLVYLDAADVTALARDLAERDSFRWWLTDLVGPLFLVWAERIAGRKLLAAGMAMRFAPDEGPDFFRPLGWQPAEVRHGWLESRRLRREGLVMRLAWTVGGRRRRDYRNVSRFVLMERR